MALYVEKFGGTSVGSTERIQAVAKQVAIKAQQGHQMVVVVSAMSGETNRLLRLANNIDSNPKARELDVLVSTGEQVTIALLCMAIHALGVDARSYTGAQAKIRTDKIHGKARIIDIDSHALQADLNLGRVVVVAGFQGIDENNNITTLGRGGSDTTAVALAAALGAKECRIYTDVDGVYTADPRVVKNARKLNRITYEEMLELASLGAKVLQLRSVEFAHKYKVPLRVLSSFEAGEGTLITSEENIVEQPLISGITYTRDEAKVTVRAVPDTPGIAHKILDVISNAHINVDMIIQNISNDGLTDFTFTVPSADMQNCINLLEPVANKLGAADVTADDNLSKISVVGIGMRSHEGIATTMFKALSDEGINIQMIATSEIKISVTVRKAHTERAVQALHHAFNLEN